MAISINSTNIQFTLFPETGTWSLHGTQQKDPFIEHAWMQLNYRCKKDRFDALHNWHGAEIQNQNSIDSPFGKLNQITVTLGPDRNQLHYMIEFALSEDFPLFLWRLTLENHGEQSLEIDRILMFQAGKLPIKQKQPSFLNIFKKHSLGSSPQFGAIRPHPDPGELAFFSNGWQSWSYTGTYGAKEKYRNTNLGFLTAPIWFNDGTPRPHVPGHFASDMFGVLGDRKHRSGILAGFLSQKEHFGSLEARTDSLNPALALWANGDQALLDPGALMKTDWAAIQFVNIDAEDPLGPFIKAASREHHLPASITEHPSSIGWCSWYHFFQDISEEKINKNLQIAAETPIPFDLFQIDDGFQAQIGDWLKFSPGFPEGVAPLAHEIHKSLMTPGIWFAPFIVHSKSQLKRNHPDWLLRNHRGLPINAGFVWNNFNNALDLTRQEPLAYVKEVIHTAVHDWGYKFLKLDFLYAAAIKGCYSDPTKTRAQVLRMGLEALREAAGPDVHLLGCGVPLGTSIGIFDSMRIGPDVDPNWAPSFGGFQFLFQNEYPMPSTRNAIQNTLTRAFLHQRWWTNDPDCLLVRPNTNLALCEIQSLATVIALSGGPLLLSDDLQNLPPERLHIVEQLVPLIGQRPRALDWFDTATPRLLGLDLENLSGKWFLLAVFNWTDSENDISINLEKFNLPQGKYYAREFWTGSVTQMSNRMLHLKQVPPHGVRLFALRSPIFENGCYLGSDLHISQGLEVTHWAETEKNINFRIEKPGINEGHIDLYLPHSPARLTLNKKEIPFQNIKNKIFRVRVQFEKVAEIEIT
jgi:alpha-galactosidase